MNCLKESICRKVIEVLGDNRPLVPFVWYQGEVHGVKKGVAFDLIKDVCTPAFSPNEILMPGGILEQLAIIKKAPTGAPGYKEKISFINIWEIEGWESAEEYINELL